MRAGGCSVQQALTVEAASVVKQALALARRRGHAQVTPLHVASTMLSASNGLLRTACLQSHSHPLQCKALELCFNVALNRLPASSSCGPILGASQYSSQQYPTISNALVAAFKRAQAHQRRGSVENQQQPLLAVKIELEQLIISILDDPSVSRVMREAGFSSTQVKSNVEQAVCSKENHDLIVLPQPPSTPINAHTTTAPMKVICKPINYESFSPVVKDEDVAFVFDSLINKRSRKSSFVIVGECLAGLEGVVGRMMDKIDKGDGVEVLREVKFVSIQLKSFVNLNKEEVEQKVGELTCLVRSSLVEGKGGVVLYLGDLKWITDYRDSCCSSTGHEEGIIRRSNNYYCPVEHMIMELGRLVRAEVGENINGRYCWLLGIATFQVYMMRCRSSSGTGYHSLETLWGLHPITLPAANLGLSLSTESTDSERRGKKAHNYLLADEVPSSTVKSSISNSSTDQAASMSSQLPSWLKDESKRLKNNNQNSYGAPVKWNNTICTSVDNMQTKSLERSLTFNSPSSSPSSSTSYFSSDQNHIDLRDSRPSTLLDLMRQSSGVYPKQVALSPITTNSASSSDILMIMAMDQYYIPRFKEFNTENLNILCNALEQKVPWQKDVIPDIVGTILQCRSGMLRRKDQKIITSTKEETWLFFLGLDGQAKEKIARELAKVVFGSYSSFSSMALSSFSSSTRADSTEELRNKRSRDEQSSCSSYMGRLGEAISLNPHRVFLVEDVEQADFTSQLGIKRAIERGTITNSSTGEEVSLRDAIVILSCESFSSRSRACSPPVKQKLEVHEEAEKGTTGAINFMDVQNNCSTPRVSMLDLNVLFDDDDEHSLEGDDDDQSIDDDVGILENVDRCILFKVQQLWGGRESLV